MTVVYARFEGEYGKFCIKGVAVELIRRFISVVVAKGRGRGKAEVTKKHGGLDNENEDDDDDGYSERPGIVMSAL